MAPLFHLRQWKFLIFAVALPISLSVIWQLKNGTLPRADAGDYYQAAQSIYYSLHEDGLVEAFKSMYFERGWRPIFFPVLAAPFVILTQDQILLATALTCLTLFFVFLTFVYRLSRIFLSPLEAIPATWMVGTLPWLINFSNKLMSEMAMMTCGMAAFYYLIRSQFFSRSKYTLAFGVWFSLGLWIRPVEMVFSFTVPLIWFLFISHRRQTVRLGEIALSLLCFGIFAANALIYPDSFYQLLIVGSLVGIAPMVWLRFRKGDTLNQGFLQMTSLICILVAFWWAPGVGKLLSWVFLATGKLAEDAYAYGEMTPVIATYSFFKTLGGNQMLVSSIVFIIFYLLSGRKFCVGKSRFFPRLQLLCLGMIFPPVIALSLTPDIDYRRAFIGFSILHLFLLIASLNRNLPFRKLRLSFFFFLAIFQMAFIGSRIHLLDPQVFYLFPLQGAQSYEPPEPQGDYSQKVFSHLASIYPKKSQFAVLSINGMDCSTLLVLENKYRKGFYFNYPQLFGEITTGIQMLKEQYDYVILNYSTPENIPTKRQPGYHRLNMRLREYYDEGNLHEAGLKFEALFRGADKDFLILATQRNLNKK